MECLYYPEIDSTQEEAKRLISAEKTSTTAVVYADLQTAGRGSRGRQWQSEKTGNLLATYVFPIDQNWPLKTNLAVYPLSLGIFSFLSGLLARHTKPGISCPTLQIKWPNDILLNGKKIAGALHEIGDFGGRRYFLSGVGINIAWHPGKTAFPATHLKNYASDLPETEKLVLFLGECLQSALNEWQKIGFQETLEKIRPHLYRLGEEISVFPARDRSKEIKGIFDDIDLDGALLIKNEKGLQKITAGDIFPSLT